MKKYFQHAGRDVPASIVVFLVALPLCLGVAQASNPFGQNIVPLFGGLIAGVVGGILVGLFSGSQISISGPAAGLTAVVSAALVTLSGTTQVYETFILAVVLAGVMQVLFGFMKAGVLGDYVPNSVIKGMLAAIGLLLILKQLPHFVGEDIDPEGDLTFEQSNKKNTFTAIYYAFKFMTPSAAIIGAVGIAIMILWDTKFCKTKKLFQFVPGALIVVVVGVAMNEYFKGSYPSSVLGTQHLVNLPENKSDFFASFRLPNFSALGDYHVWVIALTIALVASMETLLNIEALDKLDSLRRVTPTDRELKVQGIGNIVSGLLGGLPIASVIVRSSVNVNAGVQTRKSSILQGLFLLLSVLFIPFLLNKIPLSAIAAILIFTGYKLARVSLFMEFYKKGWDQFMPFVVTIVAILLTDILKGVFIGIAVGLFYMLRNNFRSAVLLVKDKNNYMVRLRKDVSFLNKPIIKNKLEKIPANSFLLIDAQRADFIDKDIIEEINNFLCHAHLKNITVEIKKNPYKESHLLFNEPLTK